MTKTTSKLCIKRNKFIFFLIFLGVIPLGVAHLDAGEDRQVGDFVVDLGYSPAVLNTHDRSTLSFFLLDDQQKPLDYRHAWIRITRGDAILFAGPIASEERNALITHTFPQPGEYQVTVRFFNEEGMIVQTEFLLKVGGKGGFSQLLLVIPTIAFFILLYFIFKKKSK